MGSAGCSAPVLISQGLKSQCWPGWTLTWGLGEELAPSSFDGDLIQSCVVVGLRPM